MFDERFYRATPFEECGLAIVVKGSLEWGVININGEYVIEPTNEYQEIEIIDRDKKIKAYKGRNEYDFYDFDGNKLEQ